MARRRGAVADAEKPEEILTVRLNYIKIIIKRANIDKQLNGKTKLKNENWPGIRRISLLRWFYFSSLFLALPVGQCTSHITVFDVAVWVNATKNEKRKLPSPPAAKNTNIHQASESPPTVRNISSKFIFDEKISQS